MDIVIHKKPFSDVDVIKKCFSEITSTLFSDDKKLHDIQFVRNSMQFLLAGAL